MSFLQKKIYNKKTIVQNITTIYGIGQSSAAKICTQIGIDPHFYFSNLRSDQINKILSYIEKNYNLIETQLKIRLKNNNNFSSQVKNYKYLRLKAGLPAHGQRTHSNAKTAAKKSIK